MIFMFIINVINNQYKMDGVVCRACATTVGNTGIDSRSIECVFDRRGGRDVSATPTLLAPLPFSLAEMEFLPLLGIFRPTPSPVVRERSTSSYVRRPV